MQIYSLRYTKQIRKGSIEILWSVFLDCGGFWPCKCKYLFRIFSLCGILTCIVWFFFSSLFFLFFFFPRTVWKQWNMNTFTENAYSCFWLCQVFFLSCNTCRGVAVSVVPCKDLVYYAHLLFFLHSFITIVNCTSFPKFHFHVPKLLTWTPGCFF